MAQNINVCNSKSGGGYPASCNIINDIIICHYTTCMAHSAGHSEQVSSLHTDNFKKNDRMTHSFPVNK